MSLNYALSAQISQQDFQRVIEMRDSLEMLCTEFSSPVFENGWTEGNQIISSNVVTPNGQNVEAYDIIETNSICNDLRDRINELFYPNNTLVITASGVNTSSSTQFNCHGYAWHMSTNFSGNTDSVRWIGLRSPFDDDDIYWTGGSYRKINKEVFPARVNYLETDHSAVTTSQQGIFISKWQKGPLQRHHKDDYQGITGAAQVEYYILSCSEQFSNQNICTNLTIKNCKVDFIQNVTIHSNAHVSIEYWDRIKINKSFQATLGTTLNWRPE